MYLFIILALIFFFPNVEKTNDPKIIVNEMIKYHGGKKYNKFSIKFDFRDYHFTVQNKKGNYQYSRTYKDEKGTRHKQVLSNHGYRQYENGIETIPDEKTENSRSEGINSVAYFALLPQSLNDAAVVKEYKGECQILQSNYYIIKISFEQSGGGQDYQDEFYYWIDQSDYSMDYLAYTFHVNGGGARFRAAFNTRRVDGILFQDYVNYKVEKGTDPLSLPFQYEQGSLEELSRIQLKNITSD